MMRCHLCKARLNFSEMREHEPECRRSRLMVAGQRMHLRKQLVEIVQVFENFGSLVKNVKTGRILTVRSPRAFDEWMKRANIRHHRSAKPPAKSKKRSRKPSAK